MSIKYTERLTEAEIEPLVGSVGDSYDNALAETINGLYKAEVIHRRGSWRSFEAVEYATLELVDWFNHRRLPKPKINIMLPRTTSIWQRDSQPNISGRTGAVQRLRMPCNEFIPAIEDAFECKEGVGLFMHILRPEPSV